VGGSAVGGFGHDLDEGGGAEEWSLEYETIERRRRGGGFEAWKTEREMRVGRNDRYMYCVYHFLRSLFLSAMSLAAAQHVKVEMKNSGRARGDLPFIHLSVIWWVNAVHSRRYRCRVGDGGCS